VRHLRECLSLCVSVCARARAYVHCVCARACVCAQLSASGSQSTQAYQGDDVVSGGLPRTRRATLGGGTSRRAAAADGHSPKTCT
jgi:hypothetical protein